MKRFGRPALGKFLRETGTRILLVLIAVPLLSGCGRRAEQQQAADDKLQVVATLFPYYDFVRQIAGDRVDLKLVIPAGMDSHSFEPTPADMRVIQNADVLVSNGGAMEHWLTQALDAVDTDRMYVITMMDYVDTVEEDLVEGMEDADHGHGDHGESGDHGPGGHEEDTSYIDHDGHEAVIEYDEHIWTSPVNAMKLVEVIRDTLSEADPENAGYYRANTDAYLEKLHGIDAGFRQVAENRKRSMIVVAGKFPFRYLADTYRLDYRAAFSGCSTDTEPSARTIAYLIDKVRDGQIPVVYYLELSSPRVAELIEEETGAQPLLLHSCHNVTRAQFDGGVTYVDLMEGNIENLRKGLDE